MHHYPCVQGLHGVRKAALVAPKRSVREPAEYDDEGAESQPNAVCSNHECVFMLCSLSQRVLL